MPALSFIRTALKDHKVAAVTASSRFVIQRLLKELPDGVRTVVEYGPGDGVITRELLARLPADGRLLAIETNEEFVRLLGGIADPRLTIVRGDVREATRDLAGSAVGPADVVVSGIPFTLFTPEEREEVVRRTSAALRPGGRFVVYQFSPLMLPVLKRRFRAARVVFEPRNLPPYFIMVAEK